MGTGCFVYHKIIIIHSLRVSAWPLAETHFTFYLYSRAFFSTDRIPWFFFFCSCFVVVGRSAHFESCNAGIFRLPKRYIAQCREVGCLAFKRAHGLQSPSRSNHAMNAHLKRTSLINDTGPSTLVDPDVAENRPVIDRLTEIILIYSTTSFSRPHTKRADESDGNGNLSRWRRWLLYGTRVHFDSQIFQEN